MGYEDIQEFVFSVTELQNYLDYVSGKSGEQGINNPVIRIYSSSYQAVDGEKTFSTVFLAPTKGNPSSYSEDGRMKIIKIL